MRILYFSVVLGILIGQPLKAQAEEDNICLSCHLDLDDPLGSPARMYDQDVHRHANLPCSSCHGGNPLTWDFDEAKDPAAGFIGVPSGTKIISVCARCHSDPNFMRRYNPDLATDQESKYWTSGHGIQIRKGNDEVATCVSCHGVHGILPVDDPGSPVNHSNVASTCEKCHADKELMGKYDLPHEVVTQYRGSVHGLALLERGDISAPTCNNCHGNHGAAPPEVGSIQEVCGTCHINNQDLFNMTKMRRVFTTKGLHGCVVCHTAHDIQKPHDTWVGMDEGGVCARCHEPGDKGAVQAQEMHTVLTNLTRELEHAEKELMDAESKGLAVEEIHLILLNAQTALIKSRTMTHTHDANAVSSAAMPGFNSANEVLQQVQELKWDFKMRKVWLGIATIFITYLAFSIYMYLRALD